RGLPRRTSLFFAIGPPLIIEWTMPMMCALPGFALVLAGQQVRLHPQTGDGTNTYKIQEKISTTLHGSVTMNGTEKRKFSKSAFGHALEITFDVSIANRGFTGKAAEQWAQGELAGLKEADHGTVDDLYRFTESDGVAVDTFPILINQPVGAGQRWRYTINRQ